MDQLAAGGFKVKKAAAQSVPQLIVRARDHVMLALTCVKYDDNATAVTSTS